MESATAASDAEEWRARVCAGRSRGAFITVGDHAPNTPRPPALRDPRLGAWLGPDSVLFVFLGLSLPAAQRP